MDFDGYLWLTPQIDIQYAIQNQNSKEMKRISDQNN